MYELKAKLTSDSSLSANLGGLYAKAPEDGATFYPSVSEDGVISWTNDKGLDNPLPVNIKGKDGSKGDKGDSGEDGNDGKTAYAYAQDGGYTGTEAEFAKKLAVDSLQVELTSTGITDDETGLLVFSANKSVSECIEAFENGVPVYACLDPTGDAFGGVMVSCLDGLVVFEVANSLNVAKRYMIIGMNNGENDMWLGTYSDGATMADIPVPTIKATSEITPTEVFRLMLEGKDFAIIHTDATYGEMLFNSFVYSQALNGMVASIVFETAGVKFCAQLSGGLTPNTWAFSAFQLAGAEDIPTSLPNPNALTINGTAYDGSKAVDMTTSVNAMIDAKAKKGESIYYIVGNGDTAGVWTGTCEDITEYYDGLTILFKLNVAGVSGGSTLNINGLGACAVKRNASTAVTTTYPAGSIVMLTYSGGVWLTADYDANTKTSAGTSNKVGTKMFLVGGTSQNSSGVTTYTNTNCYIGTDNCLYSNGKKVAEEEDIPTALKNPNALTINGKTYDGSEAVDITIAGGSASENVLLGQTPITLSEDANVKLVGSGAHTYSVKGKTVADLSTAAGKTAVAVQLNETEEYIELVATQNSAWYSSHLDISIKGLTVDESYVFVINGFGVDTVNKTCNGHFILKSSTGATLATMTNKYESGLDSVSFTATTADIVISVYPADAYYSKEGNGNIWTARFIDFYINKAADGTTRTSIIDKSGTFTDSYALGSLSAGITITSDPSCEVYSVVSGSGGSGEAVMPLAGKTVVCFGDSLFGMYTGDSSAPAYVAKRTGATVHNVGFGGCRMSVHPTSGYAEFCMWALAKAIAENNWTSQDAAASKGSANFPDQLAVLKSIDFNDVDYIVIHYGTNDFNGAIIDNASNPKDYNTLCGALRYSIETLLTAYPKIEIFVSLPAFRFWTENGTVTYSDTKTNTNGDKLTDFVKALADTAREYNLPVIDCYYGLGINKINAATFLGDGVHHNVDGRKRFGEYIGAKLIASGDV
ncbi:MAG: SGNH/GDSL hydrolase family protein [Ruminococcaceae bacterium]|nr:SGNH/GDSL hydrolase family protein [Oscillospiraceae bacterium]